MKIVRVMPRMRHHLKLPKDRPEPAAPREPRPPEDHVVFEFPTSKAQRYIEHELQGIADKRRVLANRRREIDSIRADAAAALKLDYRNERGWDAIEQCDDLWQNIQERIRSLDLHKKHLLSVPPPFEMDERGTVQYAPPGHLKQS